MTSLAYLHDCHCRYDERSIVPPCTPPTPLTAPGGRPFRTVEWRYVNPFTTFHPIFTPTPLTAPGRPFRAVWSGNNT